MEPFLKKFFPEVYTRMMSDKKISNYCKFDSELLTSFTSSLYIAGLSASLFASLVTRAYGRKPSILAGGAAFLAGSALNGAALNIYMLILGRILLGVGVGFANQVVFFAPKSSAGFFLLLSCIIYLFCAGCSFVSFGNGTSKTQRSN